MEVSSDLVGKSEKTGICVPRGSGSVEKIEAILCGGNTSYGRLQEDMGFRLGNEAEHGSQWPCKYAALFAGQSRENVAPATKFSLEVATAVKKSIETFREIPCAALRLKRVANCHLFKGEEKICSRLNFDSLGSDLEKLSLGELCLIYGAIQHSLPFLMCPPLVSTFPIQVCFVAKPIRKEP